MVELDITMMEDEEKSFGQYIYNGERNDDGERHGNGQAFLPNGDVFEGEYRNGKRHGFGKYIYLKMQGKTRSACYIGFYSCNRKNGHGTFMYADGSKYEGNWKEDKRDGYGTYYYSNGDVYKGYWSRDRRNGQGTYTYASSGMIYEGNWNEGRRSGKGRLTFGKQSYIGEFLDDQIVGPGKYYYDDGKTRYSEYISIDNRHCKYIGAHVESHRPGYQERKHSTQSSDDSQASTQDSDLESCTSSTSS